MALIDELPRRVESDDELLRLMAMGFITRFVKRKDKGVKYEVRVLQATIDVDITRVDVERLETLGAIRYDSDEGGMFLRIAGWGMREARANAACREARRRLIDQAKAEGRSPATIRQQEVSELAMDILRGEAAGPGLSQPAPAASQHDVPEEAGHCMAGSGGSSTSAGPALQTKRVRSAGPVSATGTGALGPAARDDESTTAAADGWAPSATSARGPDPECSASHPVVSIPTGGVDTPPAGCREDRNSRSSRGAAQATAVYPTAVAGGPRKPLVYLAGPCTVLAIGSSSHLLNAVSVADKLLDCGFTPLVPNALTHIWQMIAFRDRATWLAYAAQLMRRCDAVLRLEGESEGADREVELARELGIPVYDSVTQMAELIDMANPPASDGTMRA